MAHQNNRSSSVTITKQEEQNLQNYIKYGQLSACEKFQLFIWDPKLKTFCGRTASSWSKIGLFYLIFYGILAALVAICMWVFFQTLDPRIPKWQLDRSIIGTNPGLGFRPMPMNNEETTLIWLQGSNKTNYQIWVNNTLKFLDKYYFPSKVTKGNQVKTCSYSDYPARGEVCAVDWKEWDECNREQFFNFHKNSPCIFLKLNKIYGWTPEYYDDPYNLPAEMPDSLKVHIKGINSSLERQTIWLSCEGENPADKEYLGPVKYYPRSIQGFPGYYFPYLNSEGYLSPLVAVRFERPVSGIVINVECRAWAKNIIYGRAGLMGSVHFELLID